MPLFKNGHGLGRNRFVHIEELKFNETEIVFFITGNHFCLATEKVFGSIL